MDRYPDFKTPAANEVLNRDYRIRIRDVGSDITIMAPHGGRIEPKTSVIADLIAGERFNYYAFEGIKGEGNRDLHLTSHRFDEPKALGLTAFSDVILTVHACRDREDIVYLGGRYTCLFSIIQTGLQALNITASASERFPGVHPRNICNRGRLKKGVQLEVSRGLRENPPKLAAVAEAVRAALIKGQATATWFRP